MTYTNDVGRRAAVLAGRDAAAGGARRDRAGGVRAPDGVEGHPELDHVVLYGDKNNWFAAYAYWYLKRDRATWFVLRELLGYPDVRNDNGHRPGWATWSTCRSRGAQSPADATIAGREPS